MSFLTLPPPQPPPASHLVVLTPPTLIYYWNLYLLTLLETAWREKSITIDASGNLLHYLRLTPEDRVNLGLPFNDDIEEIWVATSGDHHEEGES